MDLFSRGERRFLTSIASLGYSNPFLPERIELERAALGSDFLSGERFWSASVEDPDSVRTNVLRIHTKLGPTIDSLRQRLRSGGDPGARDLRIYEECVHHWLYQQYHPMFSAQFLAARPDWRFYSEFLDDWNRYLHIPGRRFETADEPAHVFACFRQIQRAFHLIFENIIGNSLPAATLRAAVWQSIFTYDMRRYRRTMYERMPDFPTLITGPSGTGKELVARAIAGSRYVPFDPQRAEFADARGEAFFPINLAAMSPTLIESELFGHRRGAFTGAIADRKGWLEACPPAGTVFLDELGEMDLSIQVKLLRVIESRTFSAVGDTAPRQFSGKLVAATNRDLASEIRGGRFREDLYYRLCADQIRTPSLRDQIDDSPGVLEDLALHMLRRSVGGEAEAAFKETCDWLRTNLPDNYTWPGNYRELEQCVRNVVIRRTYEPLEMTFPSAAAASDPFYERFRTGELTAEQVLSHYAALVYRLTGTYEEAARRIGIDRRTVKTKVEAFLANRT